MREIKFRAKDNLGVWRTSEGLRCYGGKYWLQGFEDDAVFWGWVDAATLGQYTGLQDCNGIEIYEGDIVRNKKHVGAVKWMQGKCCFQISPGGVFLSKSCEVLGNIYDNPELLKGGTE